MNNEEENIQYLLIPKFVYESDISSNSKLLYGLLNVLCTKEGYCWASNKYLSEKAKIKTRCLQYSLKELIDKSFIKVDINKNEKNQVISRSISLTPPAQKCTTLVQKNAPPSCTKLHIDNKSSNNKRNNITPLKEIKVSPKNENEKELLFEEFWKAYPSCDRKVAKKKCQSFYLKIPKLKEEHSNILKGLELCKLKWDNPQYIPMPFTWLNQERWKDAIENQTEINKSNGIEEIAEVTQEEKDEFGEMFNI